MSAPLHFLLSIIVPLALRTGIYYGVFRRRKIQATLLTCIILAGVSILVYELSIIPFFLPAPLLIIAAGTYLCAYYMDIPWFPDALFIVAFVEVVSYLLLKFVISPIIF
ncbi:MAG: hypothetical protein HY033_09425 [Ignavibacteriae bacterium]|nr:hypothetical protein [Ignavibacteria bacterium]MBI3365113.1 hypothetical protein [Ignavibacteriota bacterium]